MENKKKTNATMNPVGPETREIWLRLLLNEDRVTTDRAGLFLVVNSIMVAGYTIADLRWLEVLLPVAGLVFCFFWFYVAERGRKNLSFFWTKGLEAEEKLPSEQKVLSHVRAHRGQYGFFWKMPARIVLSWLFPLGWIAIWIFVLVNSCC